MLRPLILCSALLILSLTHNANARSFDIYFHPTPQAAPKLQFSNEEGEALSLADYKGKIVLVNIWATWCQPCIEEMPSLDALQQKIKSHDVAILPVAIDRASFSELKAFYQRLNMNHLPIFKDVNRSFREANIQGVPATLIFNRQGQEVARVIGEIDWNVDEVLSRLKQLSLTSE